MKVIGVNKCVTRQRHGWRQGGGEYQWHRQRRWHLLISLDFLKVMIWMQPGPMTRMTDEDKQTEIKDWRRESASKRIEKSYRGGEAHLLEAKARVQGPKGKAKEPDVISRATRYAFRGQRTVDLVLA
jgi:hypothetical protein